jgi:DNA-binding transcriptional ArsR family regulator
LGVARQPTTSDAFNAIAEPQRRRILALLAEGEYAVNDVAKLLHFEQPQASKHLKVLREVGLVNVREEGKQRLYRLNGPALKPIHDWTQGFEHLWTERLDRLEDYLRQIQEQAPGKEAMNKHQERKP